MKLFEPIKIGKLEVKNRIVMPAMQVALGMTNKRSRGYYLERARGGVGAIIMAGGPPWIFWRQTKHGAARTG